MRLTIEAFGRKLTLTLGRAEGDDDDVGQIEHDNLAAVTEIAPAVETEYDAWAFGFRKGPR